MDYVIIEKSRVKAHLRTRRGKLERVKEFERKGEQHGRFLDDKEVKFLGYLFNTMSTQYNALVGSIADSMSQQELLSTLITLSKTHKAEHYSTYIDGKFYGTDEEDFTIKGFRKFAKKVEIEGENKSNYLIENFWHMGVFTSRMNYDTAKKAMNISLPKEQKRELITALASFGPGEMLDEIGNKFAFGSDVFSPKYDKAKSAIIHEWCVSAGTPMGVAMQYAAKELEPNKGKKLYVHANGYYFGQDSGPSTKIAEHLKSIYNETQDYYKRKGVKEFEVYRGVKHKTVIHQPIESWTLDYKVAKKFNGGGVMKATVPIESVLMSWESMKGVWPKESELNGKKEITVMGSGISNVEVM